MPVPPGTLKTYTPDGVVGIVEPQTLGLTSRTLYAVTGFLLSAMNATSVEGRKDGRNPIEPVFS